MRKLKDYIKRHKYIFIIISVILLWVGFRKVQLYLELQRNLANTERVIMGEINKEEMLEALEGIKEIYINYYNNLENN